MSFPVPAEGGQEDDGPRCPLLQARRVFPAAGFPLLPARPDRLRLSATSRISTPIKHRVPQRGSAARRRPRARPPEGKSPLHCPKSRSFRVKGGDFGKPAAPSAGRRRRHCGGSKAALRPRPHGRARAAGPMGSPAPSCAANRKRRSAAGGARGAARGDGVARGRRPWR